jgi:hypothetical protein
LNPQPMAYESTAPPLSYLTGRQYVTTLPGNCQQTIRVPPPPGPSNIELKAFFKTVKGRPKKRKPFRITSRDWQEKDRSGTKPARRHHI